MTAWASMMPSLSCAWRQSSSIARGVVRTHVKNSKSTIRMMATGKTRIPWSQPRFRKVDVLSYSLAVTEAD